MLTICAYSMDCEVAKLHKALLCIFLHFFYARDYIYMLIIHMKKLLHSDWLRAVQLKCKTSAKSVTPVQKV